MFHGNAGLTGNAGAISGAPLSDESGAFMSHA